MSESYSFESVDRFVVGTVGEPGRRTFLFQIEAEGTTVVIKTEKQQVSVLAEYLSEILQDVARPGHLPEDMDLRGPFDIAWATDSITAVWSDEADRFLIELTEAEGGFGEPGTARFSITREQAAALAISATALVESGRPPCPLCGYPIDPAGHACPKTNGNRPPAL